MVSNKYASAFGSLSCPVFTIARRTSSSNRATIRAAQNASAASSRKNAGFGYSVFHLWGSKRSAS